MPITFRPASIEDISIIDDIYNQAIKHGGQTADAVPLSQASRLNWFADHSVDVYPVSILEEGGKIIGWSSLSQYRGGREALSRTAEISYYLNHKELGKGYGSKIFALTVDLALSLGYKTLVAILLDTNVPSIGLLKKFGFEEWGRIPKVARIGDEYIDHLYFGKHIG